MASFEKYGDGKTRVFVEKLGVRKTKVFNTMRDARNWAAEQEAEILAGKSGNLPDKTFGDLLERYHGTLDTIKRRADIIRLKRIVRDDKIAEVKVKELSSTHVATWRDNRLKQVSAASVRREWNLLSPACKVAIKEWGWLRDNPFSEIKRPPKPDARDRRPKDEEIEQIKHVSGYNDGKDTQTAKVCTAFLFAIETGMRIGEICNLRAEDVHLDKDYLSVTGKEVGGRKTKGSKRDVALSAEAKRLLQSVKCDFRFTSSQVVDATWRTKIIAKTTIENLHFHDSRHEAITRLARKLDILDLARMVGVVDLKTLMVYYNAKASEIAGRLNS